MDLDCIESELILDKSFDEGDTQPDDLESRSARILNPAPAADFDQEYQSRSEKLPLEWKTQYGSVVWVKTQASYPWWPSFIYNPLDIDGEVKKMALKSLGKKQIVYYYGSNNYDFASLNQIKPFAENLEAFKCQKKMAKKYIEQFRIGVELAEKDASLPIEGRVAWNHSQISAQSPPATPCLPNTHLQAQQQPQPQTNQSLPSDQTAPKTPKSPKPRPQAKSKSVEKEKNSLKRKMSEESHSPEPKLQKIELSRQEKIIQLKDYFERLNFDKSFVLKVASDNFSELESLNLTFDEIKSSNLAFIISNLRKHTSHDISQAAKKLRIIWKKNFVPEEPTPAKLSECKSNPGSLISHPASVASEETFHPDQVTIASPPPSASKEVIENASAPSPQDQPLSRENIQNESQIDIQSFSRARALELLFVALQNRSAASSLENRLNKFVSDNKAIYYSTVIKLCFSLQSKSFANLKSRIILGDPNLDFCLLFTLPVAEFVKI